MEKYIKNKIDALQIIRGYAAILVALCHIWNDEWLPDTLVDFGGFGVDIFFVMSGLIMCLTVKLNTGSNARNAKYFMKKRISRIYPAYIICAIPVMLFVTQAEGIKDLYFYIGNLLLLPTFTGNPNYRLALAPGWSLTYEMFFYVVFSFVLLFSSNRKKILYTVFFILTIGVLLVYLLNIQGEQLNWVNFSYMIGDASYSIYLIHYYFTFFKFKALELVDYNASMNTVLLNTVDIIMFILSIATGCLFYVFIEKPIVNFVSKKVKA
ncbi:TPA: acyltransferase family protein [Elizabethkingia anophelis]